MDLIEKLFAGGGILILAITLVQVAPIKINPWSTIARAIGKAVNQEVMARVDALEISIKNLGTGLNGVEEGLAEQSAVNCRSRILRFGDEVIHGTVHTKEHFDQTLHDITVYERYCESHPGFVNNMTKLTSQRIEEIYVECMKHGTFL